MEISVEYMIPQLVVVTLHLYWPPSSTARLLIMRNLHKQNTPCTFCKVAVKQKELRIYISQISDVIRDCIMWVIVLTLEK